MKYLKHILATTVMVLFATTALAGEKVEVKIRRIYVDDNAYTPYYTVETEQNHDQGASQRWVRLAVEYTTRGGWIDELTIDHKALVYHHGGSSPVILDKKVSYMHIAEGSHISYVYMHPNCVKRYDVRAKNVDVAISISIGGKVVASETSNKKTKGDWSNDPKYQTSSSHLLDDSETPFWFINYDYKEMIKDSRH